MTAEIAIMNKHAVALAADSAVTLGSGRKIYNSADKLFALSKYKPVGIMVYGSASLLQIPWEVLVKHYRQNVLGNRSFPTLEEYTQDFLKFLRETPHLSSEAEEIFVLQVFWKVMESISQKIQDNVKSYIKNHGSISRGNTDSIIEQILLTEKDRVEKLPYIDKANNKSADSLRRKYSKNIIDLRGEAFQNLPFNSANARLLSRICSECVFKKRLSFSRAGVVIAGYGDDDLFPSIETYEIEGRVSGFLKAARIEKHSGKISLHNTAGITPFAQSEMVATFMNGVHPDYGDVLHSALDDVFDKLGDVVEAKLKTKTNTTKIKELRTELSGLTDRLKNGLRQYSRTDFVSPVLETVAALPKDELASMAEALVSLTSFRRKVTPEAATVGGPIDVLVISKGDGLVWIKRKMYFDPKLNHQYFSNYFNGVYDACSCDE